MADPNRAPGERVDMFQLKNSVETGLKEIYSAKIEADTGIKLSPDDWSRVSVHLNREALDNPEKVKEMAEKIREFKNLPKQIERQIQYIYSGGGESKLKEMEKLLSDKDTRVDTGRELKWTEIEPIEEKDQETRLEQITRYGKYLKRAAVRTLDLLSYGAGRVKDVAMQGKLKEKALQKVREDLESTRAAKLERKQMEERLEAIKKEIFDESMMPAAIIAEITRNKLREEFSKLLEESAGSTDSGKKILELKQRVEKAGISSVEKGGLDYNKENSLDEIANKLDTALAIKAKNELLKSLNKMGSVADLEATLKPFMEGDDRTRDFLVTGIKRMVENAEGKKIKDADRPKLAILKIFLANIENQEIQKRLAEGSWLESTRAKINESFK